MQQWCDQIGIKLIFAALHRHIKPCTTKHSHEGFYIIAHFFFPLPEALLQESAFELSISNQRIDQRQQVPGSSKTIGAFSAPNE